ncbi:MAG: GDP-L-fucose synthase [Bacteroidales bacterium OttesenSCG-928-I14]|jgi:GDP-L-fucose synthase|nr:GDP-L-fucose synthase [Bacteroidales bacterium OttesenSCG-928-I14]
MKKNAKIYVAGHTGLVGSALIKKLREKGYTNLLTKTSKELNLINQETVFNFFKNEKPEYVFLSAAKVGGIIANNIYRGQFIYENLQIQNNVIHASYKNNVKKLLFLGSTCIYPKESPQPILEDYLLTSPLEYTNEPYAIAKIAGIKMCENYNIQYGTNFITAMPTNLYGPNDNFDLEKSHVLPALLRKIHLAKSLMDDDWHTIQKDLNKRPIEGLTGIENKEIIINKLSKYGIKNWNVEIFGTGDSLREFLWSEEMADACIHIMRKINFSDLKPLVEEVRNTHINIGTGKEISINQLTKFITETVKYSGSFYFNQKKTNGTMRKLSNLSRIHKFGWHHKINIEKGIQKLYDWYLKNLFYE